MRALTLWSLAGAAVLAAVFLHGSYFFKNVENTPAPGTEGFAVYLTKYDVPPDKLEAYSHIEIADEPVFSAKDIIRYDAATHEITLTQDAMAKITSLHVPVSGKSFVVCIDRRPVYSGAFWTPISSIAYNGVVIMVPPGLGEGVNSVKIEPGYPVASGGADPRFNPVVMESLRRAGRLKQ